MRCSKHFLYLKLIANVFLLPPGQPELHISDSSTSGCWWRSWLPLLLGCAFVYIHYPPSLNLTNQTCISQEKMMPMMRMNQEECVSSPPAWKHLKIGRRCRRLAGLWKEGKEFALFARTINYSMKVMLQMRKISQLQCHLGSASKIRRTKLFWLWGWFL